MLLRVRALGTGRSERARWAGRVDAAARDGEHRTMQTIMIEISDGDADAVRSLLLRSIAADKDEIRRLNMLSTAYADHVRGDAASRELEQVRGRVAAAQALLVQLGGG